MRYNKGQGVTEAGVLFVLLVVATVGAINLLGPTISNVWDDTVGRYNDNAIATATGAAARISATPSITPTYTKTPTATNTSPTTEF